MSLNIIIIEDERVTAMILKKVLGDLGHSATVRQTLRTGFLTLKTQEFDLIILDLNLSDSKGFETFTYTRLNSPDIPILIYSLAIDEEIAVQAVEKGAGGFILKSGNYLSPELIKLHIAIAIKTHEFNKLREERFSVLRRSQLSNIAQLSNVPQILTACAKCGKVKMVNPVSGDTEWVDLADYLSLYGIELSHGLCGDHMSEQLTDMLKG